MSKPKTMTVNELRKLLDGIEGDTLVGFAIPAGDYWHTTLLGGINTSGIAVVEWSEYHRAFKVLNADDEQRANDIDSLPSVLILE